MFGRSEFVRRQRTAFREIHCVVAFNVLDELCSAADAVVRTVGGAQKETHCKT